MCLFFKLLLANILDLGNSPSTHDPLDAPPVQLWAMTPNIDAATENFQTRVYVNFDAEPSDGYPTLTYIGGKFKWWLSNAIGKMKGDPSAKNVNPWDRGEHTALRLIKRNIGMAEVLTEGFLNAECPKSSP